MAPAAPARWVFAGPLRPSGRDGVGVSLAPGGSRDGAARRGRQVALLCRATRSGLGDRNGMNRDGTG